MEFRFRYRGPDGGEIEVSSLEQLRSMVQEGAVGEATLLYDALTQEWAPARAHAVFRFIREQVGQPADTPAAPPAPRPAAGAADALDLGMTLSLEELPNYPDADEAVAALLKERERDGGRVARPDNLALSWSSPTVHAPTTPAEAPAPVQEAVAARVAAAADVPAPVQPVAPAAAPARPAPVPAPIAFTSPAPAPAPKQAASTPAPAAEPVVRPITSAPERAPISLEVAAASLYGALRVDRVTAWLDDFGRTLIRAAAPRMWPRALVVAGIAGLALLVLSTVRREDAAAAATAAQASMSVTPTVGRLVNRFASAEQSGFASVVAGVDSLRHVHRIAEVPVIWLEGRYLADAHRYPEVADFWTRYQAFLAEVAASDTALYRAGFVRSLEEQGIGGAVLSLRLGQAMREFEKSQPRREDVYRQMGDLSSAALELHALLVDRAGDITYEPAMQKGVSREPVVEAVAEDALLRDEMWTLLERIFAALEWGGDLGGSRDNLTIRLLQGIEASAR